ncbi:hypothetical protein J3Q64DRAFT_1707475, partial [Phycomyces blakesleeanus]
MPIEEEPDMPDQLMEFPQPVRIPPRDHIPNHQQLLQEQQQQQQQQQFAVETLVDAVDALRARDRENHFNQHQIDRVQPQLQQIWAELDELRTPGNRNNNININNSINNSNHHNQNNNNQSRHSSPGYDSELDNDAERHQQHDNRSIREESPLLHGYPTEEDNQRDRRQEHKANAGGVQPSRQSSSGLHTTSTSTSTSTSASTSTTAGRWDYNGHN